jgi:hypothetical protein
LFWQFHTEGYVIQFFLNDGSPTDSTFVFDSETIENFPEGGKARFTINIYEEKKEIVFDVSYPGST